MASLAIIIVSDNYLATNVSYLTLPRQTLNIMWLATNRMMYVHTYVATSSITDNISYFMIRINNKEKHGKATL